jgi:predicted transcriptional regulator
MAGKNWNSRSGTYTNIISEKILNKSKRAQELRSNKISVDQIAKELGLSKSRIYEYLKK